MNQSSDMGLPEDAFIFCCFPATIKFHSLFDIEDAFRGIIFLKEVFYGCILGSTNGLPTNYQQKEAAAMNLRNCS